MNTVRICDPTKNMPRAYIEGIEAETNWTPEEVAVLAGLDAAAWISFYWGYAAWVDAHDEMVAKDVYTYLRSHIQAEIKRQEASK